MGKKEIKEEFQIEETIEEPVVKPTPVVKKEYKTLMDAAKALASGEIKTGDLASLDFNANDVKAIANHLKNSK